MELKHKIRECPQCGMVFEGGYAGRALAGHMWLAHQIRSGYKAELEDKIKALETELKRVRAESKQEIMDLQLELRSANDMWGQALCPHCHSAIDLHKQTIDKQTGKKGFQCPD